MDRFQNSVYANCSSFGKRQNCDIRCTKWIWQNYDLRYRGRVVGGSWKWPMKAPTSNHDIFTPPSIPPPSPTNEGREQDSTIYTSQSIKVDYLTTKGIETRTGVQAKSIPGFITKEFLDNSADYLETQHVRRPEIIVVI